MACFENVEAKGEASEMVIESPKAGLIGMQAGWSPNLVAWHLAKLIASQYSCHGCYRSFSMTLPHCFHQPIAQQGHNMAVQA